jgi:hypothetical protein
MSIALAVTNCDNGKRERFHPDLVYQVEPQRSGAVISVRGVGKVHVAEPFSKVRAELRAAKLQVADEPIYR